MAALLLFADWGIRYGFGAFWVPLLGGLGFYLLFLLVPRLDKFLDGSWTLHGYLDKSIAQSQGVTDIDDLDPLSGLT